MPARVKTSQKTRLEIAAIAAKLVAIEGVTDYHAAKRKAAVRLGLPADKNLPTNREVENALIDYQCLFQPETRAKLLKDLRGKAVHAMKLLREFDPRLVGPVATGTATQSSEIVLHLYSDEVERIGLYLFEHGIPGRICEKHVRINARETAIFPAYRFIADQTAVMLVVFSRKERALRPISSIDNKVMKMLALEELVELLECRENSTDP